MSRWIREDREDYLLAGFLVTGLLSSYLMAYWHKTDKVNAYLSMSKYRLEGGAAAGAQPRETGYSMSRQKSTVKKYYRLDPAGSQPVPLPEEEE